MSVNLGPADSGRAVMGFMMGLRNWAETSHYSVSLGVFMATALFLISLFAPALKC